ncbi:MAG: NAD-dependent deacylase [Planctomycetota bacterium]|nr:NAD-dependent deacylase [Planctomycetota bacterium]
MNEIDFADRIAKASDLLAGARSVVVLSGAGISAESGVPTYRGAGAEPWDGLRAEQWATPEGYARDRQRVWKWYSDRRVQLGSIRPNAGHDALARLQRHLLKTGGKFTLATQNIDGLHQAAGCQNVLELHGSLLKVRCSRCSYRLTVGYEPMEEIPSCPDCGRPLRPAVVWFGETLPQDAWQAAVEAAQNCDLFMSVGTSATVYPAAGLVELAVASGARSIEVNLEPTPASGLVDIALHGQAGDVLTRMVGRRTG